MRTEGESKLALAGAAIRGLRRVASTCLTIVADMVGNAYLLLYELSQAGVLLTVLLSGSAGFVVAVRMASVLPLAVRHFLLFATFALGFVLTVVLQLLSKVALCVLQGVLVKPIDIMQTTLDPDVKPLSRRLVRSRKKRHRAFEKMLRRFVRALLANERLLRENTKLRRRRDGLKYDIERLRSRVDDAVSVSRQNCDSG